LISKSRSDIQNLLTEVQSAESIGGPGMHAAALSPKEDASGEWPVPKIVSDAPPGRLKVLGKREIEWDEELDILPWLTFMMIRTFKWIFWRIFQTVMRKVVLQKLLLYRLARQTNLRREHLLFSMRRW
jgi:hypothetical protein